MSKTPKPRDGKARNKTEMEAEAVTETEHRYNCGSWLGKVYDPRPERQPNRSYRAAAAALDAGGNAGRERQRARTRNIQTSATTRNLNHISCFAASSCTHAEAAVQPAPTSNRITESGSIIWHTMAKSRYPVVAAA
jgi:hypothetical protein